MVKIVIRSILPVLQESTARLASIESTLRSGLQRLALSGFA